METFSALLAICAGNSLVPGEFHTQRPVTRSFGVFFDLRLNKSLSKELWGWWFETLSPPLCRHCNEVMPYVIHYQKEKGIDATQYNYTDVTWEPWGLKSPATWCVLNKLFVKANDKENIDNGTPWHRVNVFVCQSHEKKHRPAGLKLRYHFYWLSGKEKRHLCLKLI